MNAVDTSIDAILEQLTTGTGLAIERADILGDRVTAQLENVPLELGLREILKNHDAFFFYGADKDAASALKVVWVYPRGRGRGVRPVPPELWASTKELESQLKDKDPEVRAQAIRTLVERRGSKAQDLVVRALAEEPSGEVRAQALYAATESDIDLSPSLLAHLAITDSSDSVRYLALEALGKDPSAKPIAERALNDSSPHVRAVAKQILARREGQSGRQAQQPATQQVLRTPSP